MTDIIKITDLATASSTEALEVLSFTLGGEEYGIDIQRVQELRGYDSVTRLASAPDYIKGVINLRGTIVPIIDMRIKLRLSKASYDMFTVVIILNVGNRVIGMVVDSVSDVVALTREQIKPAPELGSKQNGIHLLGIATIGDRMLILADVEKLMSSEDIGLMEKIAA